MSFYIDSADRSVIAELWPSGAFAGVTTNPTILARAGLGQADIPELYSWMTDLGISRIYAQVLGQGAEEMLASAASLRDLGPIVVKVPANEAGIAAAKELVNDGAEVLMTAVYHPVQAVIARDIGAQGVAPYVGRMSDNGRPGVQGVSQMQQAIGSEPTRILGASLRSLDDVAALAAAGVPDFTLGEPVARALLHDELTEQAVAGFEADGARFAR